MKLNLRPKEFFFKIQLSCMKMFCSEIGYSSTLWKMLQVISKVHFSEPDKLFKLLSCRLFSQDLSYCLIKYFDSTVIA